MIACENEIKDAIAHELIAANEVHPPFASLHEAYAVILEELEEAEEALTLCRTQLELAWERLRSGSTTSALIAIRSLGRSAEHLAKEGCQVSAMAIKAQQSEAERR